MSIEFEEFVRTRTPALLRSAYLLTGDQQLAEDLVQSALARTHRSWAKLHRVGNAEAYTRKVLYHLQVAWWQRRRFREGPLEGTDPAGPSVDHAVRLDLQRALLQLPPRQRAVIVLRFFEDRTEAETARLLEISVGTVKSQTTKALARLRRLTAVEEVFTR
ncbi:SigE family RNA polymerase sigma factor [Actinomadura rubrisoli]|uniref:SigE family RNA polymerase sigma factor n=1 Tax=Actinomadura rubrisoli TaxID=2530368 RepID=A0A4R5BG16_9ACTN|nr:SigE family RNA polymerase sigma factor [Actinomadura rubrisoli]TDD82622.1 SigE family RNA polymerase sigma factor [Actinomadura rubrisoli]